MAGIVLRIVFAVAYPGYTSEIINFVCTVIFCDQSWLMGFIGNAIHRINGLHKMRIL
jgi:hypothetical protein